MIMTSSSSGDFSREELLAIGFAAVGNDCKVSRHAHFFATSGRLGDGVRIDALAILTGHIELDDHAHVSPFSFLGGTGGKIQFGKHAGISTHCSLFTKSDDYSGPQGQARDKVSGDIVIGDHSIIGAGATVMPGTTIGRHCTIGAGCLLTGTIADQTRLISMGVKSVKV